MRGYIAITTTIILSLVMLALALTIGSTTLSARLNSVDLASKRLSYFVARSCLDYARLKLAESGNYAGNETRTIGQHQCTIQPIETESLNKIIKARAQVKNAITNLKLIVNSTTLNTVSLEELAKF